MKMPRVVQALTAVLTVGIVAAGGAGVGLVLAAPATPQELRGAESPPTAPVTFQDFSDPRPVQLAFTQDLDVTLTASVSGQVTAYGCTVNGTLESGQTNLSVDGSPIVSIATRVPLWRDLQLGDSGEDVLAFQEELQRLGFSIVADGVLGDYSIRAFNTLISRFSNAPIKDTVVSRSRLLWIPAASVIATKCGLSLGGRIDESAAVAVLAGQLSSVKMVSVPSDVTSGERVLNVDGQVLRPDSDGMVTSISDLQAFAATVSARAAISSGESATVTAQYELEAPIRVGLVAPSAIFDLQGLDGCVIADGIAVPIRVASSQLGQSAIIFASEPEPESVDLRPGSESSCN